MRPRRSVTNLRRSKPPRPLSTLKNRRSKPSNSRRKRRARARYETFAESQRLRHLSVRRKAVAEELPKISCHTVRSATQREPVCGKMRMCSAGGAILNLLHARCLKYFSGNPLLTARNVLRADARDSGARSPQSAVRSYTLRLLTAHARVRFIVTSYVSSSGFSSPSVPPKE